MTCYHCGSASTRKHGQTTNGKQRFKCLQCKRSFRDNPQPQGYTSQRKEEILRAYQERSSLRGLTRTFGVSRQTVTAWLQKKAPSCPP